MNKILLNLLIIIMYSNPINAQNDILSAFLIKWENSKNYLIELAETMPAEKYGYKPTQRQMSFQEQLIHIRGNMVWLSESYFADESYGRSKKSEFTSKPDLDRKALRFSKIASSSSTRRILYAIDSFIQANSRFKWVLLDIEENFGGRSMLRRKY